MQRVDNGPLCFWAWNGEMENNELTAQLKDLAVSGVKGVFVHSRAGLKLPYLEGEWFEKYKLTAAECKKLGLQLWIYDEDGWPSGFGGGRVYKKSDEFLQRYIIGKIVTLPSSEIKNSDILAVYKINDNGFVKADNNLNNKTGDYLILYIECNPVYIDILNKDAVQYFIKTTHERYKTELGQYFGNVIKGIFTDEPHFSPRGLPWGKYYQSFFKEKRKYDIFEALPYLFIKKEGYRKYRHDYWKTISEMTLEYYAKPYYKWCEENNLIFTGHYACEEGQLDQVATNGGVMPLYEFQHIPGVDSLGNRLVPATVFKQAESVSCQLGNKLVMCETYACSGYDTTFSDIMWIWGYQAALGVNVPCLSISMYSLEGTRKRDYPTFFSYQMPWWKRFPVLAKSFDFINSKMIEGERKQEILLINPISGIWCEKGNDNEIEEKQISAEFRMLTESLLDLQREFDYGDEQIIKKHANISGNIFYIGKCGYNTVMVPNTCNLESSTLLLLRQFSEAGGNVIFVGGLPKFISGMPADKKDFDFEKVVIQSRTDLLRKYFVCYGQKNDMELIDRYTRRTALGFVTALRCYDGYKALFVVNTSREDYKRVRLSAKGRTGLKKLCIDGRELNISARYDSLNDVTVADIEIEPQEVCFFVTAKENITEEKPVSVNYLNDFDIDISENVLVIDKVLIKADDKQLGEDFTIFSTEKLYKHIDGLEKDITLTMFYDFYINGDIDCGIDIACEDNGAEVFINGNKIIKKGWFTDRHFGR
ncbi:MAG: hypothetical protein PHE12_03815, partial [Clostridia bacterium]|nr:hypothetical protein [Clostridia bacterium]